MNGETVAVENLYAGDQIHTGPHKVYGRTVGSENDAGVTSVECIGELVTIFWRSVRASATQTGALVYERGQKVLRTGHLKAAA